MLDLVWNEIIVKSFNMALSVWQRVELAEGISLFDWMIGLLITFGILTVLARGFGSSSALASGIKNTASAGQEKKNRRSKKGD